MPIVKRKAAKSKPKEEFEVWPASPELCVQVREKAGNRVALGFSCGKDAIGAWIQLRRFFDVAPVYREVVPGLGFVEQSLQMYEEKLGAKVIRIPGERWIHSIAARHYQPPHRTFEMLEMQIHREVDLNMAADAALQKAGLDPATGWWADGWRRSDSMARALQLKKKGPVKWEHRYFSPVYDWSDTKLEQEIRDAGVPLPVDYVMFGRSFDFLRARFMGPIKRYYPEDWQRILHFYPLAEVELRRYEQAHGPQTWKSPFLDY